jgi:ParB family chromosome partitioning protein
MTSYKGLPATPKPKAGNGSTSSRKPTIKRSANSAASNPHPYPCPKKDAVKVAKLEQKKGKLQDQAETDPEADQDALYDEIESLQDQIDEIESKRTAAVDADTKAHCGTIVTIGHDGEPQLICGLLRKEDAAQLASGTNQGETETTSEEPTSCQPQAYSATLVETLTTIKTAAIAAELSLQPKIGLAAVVHALVVCEFGFDLHLYRSQTSIQINSTQPNLVQAASSLAVQSLSEQKTAWLQRFPKTPNALWQWILVQPQDSLLALLAFWGALSLNGIQTKNDSDQARIHHADAVATALSIDMRNWFAPTADNFFNRVSKPSILQAWRTAANSSTPTQPRS